MSSAGNRGRLRQLQTGNRDLIDRAVPVASGLVRLLG